MATKSKKLVPARAIHPGEILRLELQERAIRQKDFAQEIGVQATHLNEFIKGRRDLNTDLALKLEKSLGISFKFWMNLQNDYSYDKSAITDKKSEEDTVKEFEKDCSYHFNLRILYKKLGLSNLSIIERVKKLKELFAPDLLTAPEQNTQIFGLYKHSEKVQIDNKNLQTWLLLNLFEISNTKILNNYKKGNGLIAADEIANMANNRTISTDSIKHCLEEKGIAYVKVDKLDKVPVDAYSTIYKNMPVITVTYRYNDMDKLAFDILHELCHIENHLSNDREVFIALADSEYSKDNREKEANDFARQHLIPDNTWNKMLNKQCGSLSPHAIVKALALEASKLGISPSIAISRYKHDTHWYKTSDFKSPKIY